VSGANCRRPSITCRRGVLQHTFDITIQAPGTAAFHDGRRAHNANFPTMVMDATVRPGVANTVMGSVGSLAAAGCKRCRSCRLLAETAYFNFLCHSAEFWKVPIRLSDIAHLARVVHVPAPRASGESFGYTGLNRALNRPPS
jgi:hypothetical protein